ncbi:MAG: hypothetical protein LBS96_05525 [Oscillospiraceae bacterium]|jgi:hypothetical protein|nr:hypothetical protein [Oscillospiraceae bacterium]
MKLLYTITPAQVLEALAPLIALLLFLAGFALTLWRQRRTRQGAEQAELNKLEKAQATVEELLQYSLYGLVTNAERSLGAGNGSLKKSIVTTELLRLLPEQQKAAFSAETLGSWIETALEEARPLWGQQEVDL